MTRYFNNNQPIEEYVVKAKDSDSVKEVTGQAKDLFYIGDGTDMIEVLLAGLFHREVALSYQENGQPLAHRLVQGLD